jgi:hypothetical protein
MIVKVFDLYSFVWATYLTLPWNNILAIDFWRFFLNGKIMAIENLKNALVKLSVYIYIYIYIHISSEKKAV